MIKLVLDTNTMLSGFLWKGNEFELLKFIEMNKVSLFLNDEILKELEDVITRPRFEDLLKKAGLTVEDIFSKIVSLSHLVVGPKINIKTSIDPKDNKFIECAVMAKADFVVSGDKHLLNIGEYEGIKIIRTADVLEILRKTTYKDVAEDEDA